jgi:hypothetical protein
MPPLGLRTLQESAKTFVVSAKKVADKILQPLSSFSQTSSVNSSGNVKIHHHHHHCHDYYGWGYVPFWSRPTYVITPYDSYRNQREDNNGALRFFVGLVSTAVGAAAFYAIGSFAKSFGKVERKLVENRTFTAELKNFKEVNTETAESADLVNKLERIANLREKILQRMRKNNIFNLAATVTTAAACVIAVVGAVLGSPAAMAAGTLIGLGVGAVVMVKWGMDTTESKQNRDARALLQAVNELPQS